METFPHINKGKQSLNFWRIIYNLLLCAHLLFSAIHTMIQNETSYDTFKANFHSIRNCSQDSLNFKHMLINFNLDYM